MSWDLMLLVINLLALVGLVWLVSAAPCWIQKIVIGLLIIAAAIFCGAYAWAMFDEENHWKLRNVGYAFEHLAVLVYVFRLIWQGGIQWKPSSGHSPSSPRS